MERGRKKSNASRVVITQRYEFCEDLVSCPGNTRTKSMQLFEDRVGRGRPLERPTVRVVGGDEVVDALHELLDAGERPTADGLVGDQAEKSFDLIE